MGLAVLRLVAGHPEVFAALPAAIHRGVVVQSYVGGASHRGLRPDELAALVGPWLGAEGQAAFYRQIAEADERFTAEFEPLLPGMRIPVRILWGAQDTWIPPDRAWSLHALIPGSSLSIVEGAGHLVQLDAPAALADELRSWLDRQV